MEIKKIKNEYETFNIDLIDNGKVLSIFQTGLDQTISCRYENYETVFAISFDIIEENQVLYQIFSKLYESIISGNLLGSDSSEMMHTNKTSTWYKKIVNEGVITILCDAYPILCPNILKISRKNKKIILSFLKDDGNGKGEYKPAHCVSINIRQSGSRLGDFCIPFNTLFKELQDIPATEENLRLTLSTEEQKKNI